MIIKPIELVTAACVIAMLAGSSGLLPGCSSPDADKEAEGIAPAPAVEVITADARELQREVKLPGELTGYQNIAIYPKVEGFVKKLYVDRGSEVQRGDLLLRMDAPELTARQSEAEAKARSAKAQLFEAQARFAASESTYERLKAAAGTPGVVAGNDLEAAQRTMEADRARVQVWEENERAERDAVRALQDIVTYLQVTAAFDGIVTERNVHTGSLVGPAAGTNTPPMLRVQEVVRLRLTMHVPETEVAGISPGTELDFTVPAYPGEHFHGSVQRIARALDAKTRTMPVELDVDNGDGRLAPGMYAEVILVVRRPEPTLFVPASAVARTTERTFVVRINNGLTEWVDVKRGFVVGNLVEVFGNLRAGDKVVLRGTDELRAGVRVNPVEGEGMRTGG